MTLITASAFALLAVLASIMPRLPRTTDLTTDFAVGPNPGPVDFRLDLPIIFGPSIAASIALLFLARRFAAVRRAIDLFVGYALLIDQPSKSVARAAIVVAAWPALFALGATVLSVPQWVVPGAVAGTAIGIAHFLVRRHLRGA